MTSFQNLLKYGMNTLEFSLYKKLSINNYFSKCDQVHRLQLLCSVLCELNIVLPTYIYIYIYIAKIKKPKARCVGVDIK